MTRLSRFISPKLLSCNAFFESAYLRSNRLAIKASRPNLPEPNTKVKIAIYKKPIAGNIPHVPSPHF